jgi:hypothetical protein
VAVFRVSSDVDMPDRFSWIRLPPVGFIIPYEDMLESLSMATVLIYKTSEKANKIL